MPGKNTGLEIQRHRKAWYIRHTATRLPAGPMLRLRRHATQMMTELLATGADFTLPTGGDVQRSHGGREYVQVAARWQQRVNQCCESGEHYSPYTWRDEQGRCH
jgi:hypothetical protein